MWSGSINPTARRHSKREELLSGYVERVMHVGQNGGTSDSSSEILSIMLGAHFGSSGGRLLGNSNKEDTEMHPKEEAVVEDAWPSSPTYKAEKPKLATNIARFVEESVTDQIDDDIVYGRISGLVHAEIDMNTEIIVCNNLPSFSRSIHFDNIKHRCAYFAANFVGRVAESDIDHFTADLVDKAIVLNGICKDVEILNFVSNSITSSISAKVHEFIRDAVLKIIGESLYDGLPYETMMNAGGQDYDLAAEVKSKILFDSKFAATRIVDAVVLIVDDIITEIIVNAFQNLNCVRDMDDISTGIADMTL